MAPPKKPPAPDDLRAALSPGTVSTGDTLTLDITSPSDVDDLIISVVEADTGKEEEPRGPDSLVAKFFGKVASHSFILVPRKAAGKKPPPPNPETNSNPGRNPPKIKISLGGKVHEVPLPGKESENGIFELQIKMSAKGHKDFRSDVTVFVRDFQQAKSAGLKGPVIAILVGTDAPAGRNGFGPAALAYWRRHADATFNRAGLGLENVMKFLDKFKGKFGNWGEVNLINHGNLVPMFVRLFEKKDDEFLDGHKIDEELGPDTKRDTSAFKSGVGLDSDSRIVFRACDAGNNPKILEALQTEVFAGACPVFIPKQVQVYQSDGSGESFQEMLVFFHVSNTQPSDRVVEAAMKAQFDKRFPGASFATERPTYNAHGDPHGRAQNFTQFVEVREDDLFSNLATGVKKANADLIPFLVQEWAAKKLDQDDRLWLTQPSDWFVTVDEKRSLGDKADVYWATASVPPSSKKVPTSATPKFSLHDKGTVSIGSDPSNDIVLIAPGVAGRHATVEIRSFGSESSPFDLLINPVSGETIKVRSGNQSFSMPPTTNAETTGEVKLVLGSASVTFRFPRQIDLKFGLHRFMVQLRRDMRVFDPTKPTELYRNRPLVQPDLKNDQHFGKFG